MTAAAGDRVSAIGPDVDRCAVWWATPHPPTSAWDLLSDAERRRAGRFHRREDRDRFVAGRALARVVLAARLGVPADRLRIDSTCGRCGRDHGKPRIVGAAEPTEFSVTHAGGRVGVALTGGRAVGLDVAAVEPAADRVLEGIATVALGPEELAVYRRLGWAERPRALAVWWTRKEAVLKATGDGLAVSPARVRLSRPDEAPALVAWEAAPSGPAERDGVPEVRMRDLEPGPGYVACVAVLGLDPVTVTVQDGSALLLAL